MKNKFSITIKILFLIFVSAGVLYSAEKASIIYKDGIKAEFNIDEYEYGKWVVIIDDNGIKKIIPWDQIQEVVFTKPDSIANSDSLNITKNFTDSLPVKIESETVKTDSVKKDEVPMTIAQKIAKRAQERKEKEAAEAKIKADYEAEMKLKQDQQKAEEKKESKSIFNIFKKKETAEEGEISTINEKSKPSELTEEEKQRKEQVELKAQKKIEEETAKKKEDTESKSIFNVFKKQEPEKAAVAPSAAAETGSSKTEAEKTKEEKFKEEIREENKYQQKPEIGYDKDSGKMGVSLYKTLESDATRRAWIEDGGMLKGYGYSVSYSYTSMSEEFLKNMMEEAIWNDFPYEMSISSDGTTMHGFGMSYSGTLKWIKPPSYAEGRNMWGAFSIGGAGSFNFTIGKSDMSITMYDVPNLGTYTTESKSNMTITTLEFSGNVGYTIGLGKYFFSDSWKGVMLGLYWKPNFMMMTGTSESNGEYTDIEPQSNFNLSGFQWTIDWGSFGALADRIANEAHFSINGYIIPETDVTPFMLSIGLGLVYY
ncbi:MAG TPA: hypothetical protein PLK90_00030 [Clostridiales bacterium]|nr:hypothetical protein [Clostridiales bacterium]HQP68771.1 hypothetical protein [Clostridiales bacterium]